MKSHRGEKLMPQECCCSLTVSTIDEWSHTKTTHGYRRLCSLVHASLSTTVLINAKIKIQIHCYMWVVFVYTREWCIKMAPVFLKTKQTMFKQKMRFCAFRGKITHRIIFIWMWYQIAKIIPLLTWKLWRVVMLHHHHQVHCYTLQYCEHVFIMKPLTFTSLML